MSDSQLQQTAKLCPACGDALVGEYGYVEWCRSCQWNVTPKTGVAEPTPNRLGRFIHSDQRTVDRLHEEAVRSGTALPPRGWRGWLALALSIPVNLISITFAVAGIMLMISTGFMLFSTIIGIVLIAVSVGFYTPRTAASRS